MCSLPGYLHSFFTAVHDDQSQRFFCSLSDFKTLTTCLQSDLCLALSLCEPLITERTCTSVEIFLFALNPSQICQNLFMRGLSLVGWYHSHPRGPALPSLQDIDSQMDHQLRLQGSNNGFQPCLGVICGGCWRSRLHQVSVAHCSTLAAGRYQGSPSVGSTQH